MVFVNGHKFTTSLLVSFVLMFLYTGCAPLAKSSYRNPAQTAVVEEQYTIRVKAPDIAENGAVVPVTIELNGPASKTIYAREVRLYVCHMGFRPIASYTLNQPVNKLQLRVKMRRTDRLIAVATLNNGNQIVSDKEVKVTLGGCGGGGGSSSAAPANATIPNVHAGDYTRTWARSTLPYNATRLITGDNRHLVLKAVRTDVKIAGFRARVLLQMDFYNPYQRQSEGRFELRLPDFASPYYVAFGEVTLLKESPRPGLLPGEHAGFTVEELTYNQHVHAANLKEGVLVPRAKAREAYNTITWQRRDPALVEWRGSGVYSVQVFPLQAFHTHRVVLGYDMDLQKIGRLREYAYSAPFENVKHSLYVRIEKDTAKNLAEVSGLPVTTAHGQQHFYHFEPNHNETIKLRFNTENRYVLTGGDNLTGEYFAIKLEPRLPKSIAVQGNSHAVFVLDTSANPDGGGFHAQTIMLENLLSYNADSIEYFNVLFFDVGTHWWQTRFIKNTPQSRRRLMDKIHTLNLAGAADLQRALTEAASPHWFSRDNPAWDVFLFTDGRASWGDMRPRALMDALNRPAVDHVFAYTPADKQADLDILELLVSQHNGAVFHHNAGVPHRYGIVEPAVTAHRFLSWRIINAKAAGGTDISIAGAIRYHYDNQEIMLVGRGRPWGDIKLELQSGLQRRSVVVSLPEQIINSELAPRIYGETTVRQMEARNASNMKLVTAYATHFRVARKTVSLLMLESEQDYGRFGINSAPNYAKTVRDTPVAGYIANLSEPVQEQAVPPRLPANQTEELNSLGYMLSVCKLPLRRLTNMPLETLGREPALRRQPLRLTEKEIGDSDLGLLPAAITDIKNHLLTRSASRTESGQRIAALRILSSLATVEGLDANTKVEIARRTYELGFSNDSYFFLSGMFAAGNAPGRAHWLSASAKAQGQDELSAALEQLSSQELTSPATSLLRSNY